MKQAVGKIAVEGKHIVKDFRLGTTTTKALKDISLQVMQGEFVSIMGPSGPGKSTLLYILGGLDAPTGGQQQRVAIARALIGKPEILFADEPTGNLDSKTGAEIMTLLREINQSIHQTIIMVTHSPEAARSSSRIITVQDGAIL